MAFFPSKKVVITPATLLLVLFLLISSSSAQLSDKFYAKSCPQLLDIVKSVVQSAIEESRMGASLLRLHFHDCFVNDAMDQTSWTTRLRLMGRTAESNKNSARGFEVVDHIKTAVEKKCPGVVSCADILAIAARDSVVLLEGPFWEVKLGRTDAKYASLNAANKGIPLSNWTLQDINSTFNALGLSTKDLVALSGLRRIFHKPGAHTMRQDRESNFGRSLDRQTQIKFNNNYFSNLDVTTSACEKKFLEVEQTKSIATTYSNNVNDFNKDFADAMI
ncbi:hypothetical protein OROHE_014769 [Orobanche hederae]